MGDDASKLLYLLGFYITQIETCASNKSFCFPGNNKKKNVFLNYLQDKNIHKILENMKSLTINKVISIYLIYKIIEYERQDIIDLFKYLLDPMTVPDNLMLVYII